MKNKLIFALIALIITSLSVYAQAPLKVGYTNVDYILGQMPEAKQIDTDLKAYEKQLSNQLKSKMDDFQAKLQSFQQGQATMTEVVRNSQQEDLQNLQASIEKFQREAETSLQKKQVELLQPAYDKIQKAIDEVAKENAFTYVFSSDVAGAPVLLFAANDQDNISDLVLKKLGITPQKKEEGTANKTDGKPETKAENKPSVTPKADTKGKK